MATFYGIYGLPNSGKTSSLLGLPKDQTIWITSTTKPLPDGTPLKYLHNHPKSLDWNGIVADRLKRSKDVLTGKTKWGIGDRIRMISDIKGFIANEEKNKTPLAPETKEILLANEDKFSKVKFIVLDDLQYSVFVAEQNDTSFYNQSGYGKWAALGKAILDELMDATNTLREDLIIIHIWHSEIVERAVNAKGIKQSSTGIKTPGQVLRKEFEIEGMYQLLFYCENTNDPSFDPAQRILYTRSLQLTDDISICARSFDYIPAIIPADFMIVLNMMKEKGTINF